MALGFFINQFEIDETKYHGIVERNRNNGRKGGTPIGNCNAKSNLTLADIALNDNIPSLANIRSVYGEDNALRWLKVQFDSLNDYAEQGKGITDKQLDELWLKYATSYPDSN